MTSIITLCAPFAHRPQSSVAEKPHCEVKPQSIVVDLKLAYAYGQTTLEEEMIGEEGLSRGMIVLPLSAIPAGKREDQWICMR